MVAGVQRLLPACECEKTGLFTCQESAHYLAALPQSKNNSLKRNNSVTLKQNINFSEFSCILVDWIQWNQLTGGQAALRIMRRKENYGIERKHKAKKRWKRTRMGAAVACSFRNKIHIFLYFMRKIPSRIPRQNLCQLCDYRRENGETKQPRRHWRTVFTEPQDLSKFFFFTLNFSENCLSASVLILW